jgi:acetyl-CoA carboxylase biotin carboxyl carrier protein
MKKPMPKKPARSTKKIAVEASPPGPIDAALIERIGEIANRLGLAEIEVQHDQLRIRVARHLASSAAPIAAAPLVAAPVAAAALAPQAPAPAAGEPADHPGAVKSPMVGTAYLRPSPNDRTFVDVGSAVKPGDKLLLVEAMKTFNEIVAPRAGTVTAILVEDGQPVEYGQPLVVID